MNETIKFDKGISIIIPIHEGMTYIEGLIKNLNNLIVKEAKFEVIFVLNGVFEEIYQYLIHHVDHMNFKHLILISDETGASKARNLGMQYVKYSHTTFLDVDDFISSNYIEESFQLLKEDTILVTQIHDMLNDGSIVKNNPVNLPLIKYKETGYSLFNIHAILGITTCKFIPSHYLEAVYFNPALLSGEDTVFYCYLYAKFNPKIEVINLDKEVVYYRLLNENSVSRGKFSYDFNIAQRLDVLDTLDKLLESNLHSRVKKFISTKYNAQTGFISKFLKVYPEYKNEVVNLLNMKNYNHLNEYFVNIGMAKELVIAYCFPPFIDNSGILMAKRISNNDKIVDIFSNDMTSKREKDFKLKSICIDKIDQHKVSKSSVSFSDFGLISQFIDEAFSFYLNNKEKYETLYSSVLFPSSYFSSLFIKLNNPNIKWVAEFSDPLLYDIKSKERYSSIEVYNMLLESLKLEEDFQPFLPYVDESLFNLAELIGFAFADELLFTNEYQLEYMTSRFSNNLQNFIKSKSKIDRYPIPNNDLYYKTDYYYPMNEKAVQIGYFGNFYETRSLNLFLDMVDELLSQTDLIIQFHIFTNIKHLSHDELERINDYSNVYLNDTVSYLDCLNLTTKMDILIILDAKSKEYKNTHPYLPSKLSDYLGANKAILAMVEENSILSQQNHNNLYKINYSDIYDEKLNNVFQSITKNLNKKIETIDKLNQNITIEVGEVNLIYSLDLEVSRKKSQYIFKPKLPITSHKNFSLKLENTTNSVKYFKIKTLYKDPQSLLNIISNVKKYNEISINSFNEEETIEIRPNETISFELKYNKDYDKDSFKKAGTVIIKTIQNQNYSSIEVF